MNNDDNLIPFPESVELEACHWVAKLDRGNLSDEEKIGLSNWLDKDPMMRRALAEQIGDWSEMDVLSELSHLNISPPRQSLVERLNNLVGWHRPVIYLAGVGAIALVGLLALDTSTYSTPESAAVATVVDLGITTAVGEQASEAMPDGSVLHVNTTSVAEVSYSEEERRVELKTGEVFFDVAPDSSRPFVVYAGETSVRAIGTAFAVHLIDGAVEVSVTEGTVEFNFAGTKHLVSADPLTNENSNSTAQGNVAFYSEERITVDTQPLDVLSRRLAWQTGMLEFKGDPLSQIVEEVSRYTEAEIEILDEDIRDVRLGGYFRIGDLESLASALDLGFDIQLEIVSDDLIQISRGSEG